MSSLLHPPKPSLDTVTTIRGDGSRLFLHPADTRGRFMRWRRWSGWLLIVVYLSLPWIKIGQYPAVFLDVGGRRFHLFGLTLAFQDVWLLFFVITGVGFGLFFITALLGRVWCGWGCPQTVFLEHVYRWIERRIEGDATRRRALDAAPWTLSKLTKRTLKQVLFVAVSAIIAHLFLAYFVSIPALWGMMREAPVEHWSAFLFVFAFTGLLYFNFAWFREQLCIVICPYGRMQSVLSDEHTVVIGYDARRGEPRGKKSARATEPLGDCVDCVRCVQVCPTGIDIRQGLQLECIGCAACVDACDDVMTRLQRPKGLIRYASQTALEGGKTRWIRPRTVVYTVLALVGAAVATAALSTLKPASMGVTRLQGAPYFVTAETVRNQFLVRLVNKRPEAQRFVVTVVADRAGVVQTGFTSAVELDAMGESVAPLVLQVPRRQYEGPFEMVVQVSDEAGTYRLQRKIEFVGPDPALLREEEAAVGRKEREEGRER
jgi:cytochrome c oxidase accessory protein FixG